VFFSRGVQEKTNEQFIQHTKELLGVQSKNKRIPIQYTIQGAKYTRDDMLNISKAAASESSHYYYFFKRFAILTN